MGYRSQVRIVMNKEDYKDLLEQYYKEDTDKMFTHGREDLFYKQHEQEKGFECDFIYQERNNGKIVLFGWDWLKWQGEDCRFIENFVYELGDCDKKNKPCQMVIMGEDGASEEYIADIVYEKDLENDYDIIHADYDIIVDDETTPSDRLELLENELLHKRFKTEQELGEYIAKFLNVNTPVKVYLDDESDFENEKTDYNYDIEVSDFGELIADVYVWVLYDRQKQLYVTEVSFERII